MRTYDQPYLAAELDYRREQVTRLRAPRAGGRRRTVRRRRGPRTEVGS